jgi:hypothetical protein
MSVIERLPAELRERLATNRHRIQNRYAQWQNKTVRAETVCKCCGTTLAAVAPDPRIPPLTRELRGTNIRTVLQTTFVSLQRTDQYDTILFEVEEPNDAFTQEAGETKDEEPILLGLHQTAVCKGCKVKLLDGTSDVQDVQHLYDADLERMAAEDDLHGVPVQQTLGVLRRLLKRRVVRIVG